MTSPFEEHLQDCMHRFEDKVPIHGGKIDILKLSCALLRHIPTIHRHRMPGDK